MNGNVFILQQGWAGTSVRRGQLHLRERQRERLLSQLDELSALVPVHGPSLAEVCRWSIVDCTSTFPSSTGWLRRGDTGGGPMSDGQFLDGYQHGRCLACARSRGAAVAFFAT